MNSIPLIKGNTPQEINTSIIALKKALGELDRLLQGTDKDVQDEIKQINELIERINNHLTTIDSQITALQPVDTVTSGNMQSVTSNAVALSMLFNSKLHIADTRNDNFAPGYYLATYSCQIVQEFKNTSVINTPFDTGAFCTLITITPWVDLSGGLPTQFAVNTYGSGEIKYRVASDINSWGDWTR